MDNQITVIGTGYVGLVTGTCLSDYGLKVICVDTDLKKIEGLKTGIMPIYEPGLEVLVKKNYEAGRLNFTTDIASGIKESDVIFIAVGTPAEEDGSADLKHVQTVAMDIATNINGYKVIVNKSTVPVGTGQMVKRLIKEHQKEAHPFDVVSNPEFLREGAAVYDFMHPDRIVVGAESSKAFDIMKSVYRALFLNQKTPFLFTDIESAETIKYASNAFLAMKVTFINEVAALCEKVGANIVDVARGMGMDGRIGSKFLNPGPGYGGSCFPKDTKALAYIGQNWGAKLNLVETTIASNEVQKIRAFNTIKTAMNTVSGKTIGILGLAFKPETDDMRDAPSLTILSLLDREGATLRVFDPHAMQEAAWRLAELNSIVYCTDEYQVADTADALVILTEWNQFRSLALTRIKDLMNKPLIFDFRNIYEPTTMRNMGFEYYSVGRK